LCIICIKVLGVNGFAVGVKEGVNGFAVGVKKDVSLTWLCFG
jgi:hypothetical protein